MAVKQSGWKKRPTLLLNSRNYTSQNAYQGFIPPNRKKRGCEHKTLDRLKNI